MNKSLKMALNMNLGQCKARIGAYSVHVMNTGNHTIWVHDECVYRCDSLDEAIKMAEKMSA